MSENERNPERRSDGAEIARAPRRRRGGKRLAKKPAARRGRRLTLRNFLVLLLPAAAAGMAALVVWFLSRDLMTYRLDGDPIQYYGGGRFPIESGAVLRRAGNGTTVLETDGSTRVMDTLPLYLEPDTLLLAKDMVYCAPRRADFRRADCFTEFRLTEYGNVEAERRERPIPLDHGFLYDGKDIYVFLEPVELEFNQRTFSLPPLSYVEAVYTGDVMVFNHGTKECFYQAPDGEATAYIPSGDWSVALLSDVLTDSGGTRVLLETRPDLLEALG